MADEYGHAAGAFVYNLPLPARGEKEIAILASISGKLEAPNLHGLDAAAWVERERTAVAAAWRDKLDRVKLTLPPQAQRIADTLRTALAHILITRDGAALRPGTRSYARSWIRDGAMMADALLRMGETQAARDYVDWYAPHQFANGKVPCCVDHRGSDPVPENDSHGELIHAIAQLYRYGGDRAELEKNWPHIANAVAYMDTLRCERTHAREPDAGAPRKLWLDARIDQPRRLFGQADALVLGRFLGDDRLQGRGRDGAGAGQVRCRHAHRTRARRVRARPVRVNRGGGKTARDRLHSGLRRTGRLRCNLDHGRAVAGGRAGKSAARAVAQHLRTVLAQFHCAQRRQQALDRLHTLRMAHGRQLRAPGLARPRAGGDRFFLRQRRASRGMEPMGRSGWP